MEAIKQLFESGAVQFDIPDTLAQIIANAGQYIKFLGLLFFGVLLLSSLNRFLFGKEAQINLAVTAAMEILCLYVINIVIYALGLQYDFFLDPLPFVTLSGDSLTIFPILSADMHAICTQLVRLLLIAFLVNLVGGLIPKGESILGWTLLRLITVALSAAALYGADLLLAQYLPQGFADFAPTVLVLSLVALIALGSLKVFVGAALAFLDPLIAALYTFFFSNIIGRALARAMVTTALIAGLIAALNFLEITVLHIAAAALSAYIPLLVIVILLWYFVGRIL